MFGLIQFKIPPNPLSKGGTCMRRQLVQRGDRGIFAVTKSPAYRNLIRKLAINRK